MPMSCCMCEPMETAQSLGDDTHAVAMGPMWAGEHGLHCVVWSLMSVGCKPGQSTGARTRTRANVSVRPRPLAQRTGKEKERGRGIERKNVKEKDRKEGRKKVEVFQRSLSRQPTVGSTACQGVAWRRGAWRRHYHTLPQVSLGEKAALQDTRTSIHKAKMSFSFRNAPMLVTHWMEAGTGTLGFVNLAAAVWNVRTSLLVGRPVESPETAV